MYLALFIVKIIITVNIVLIILDSNKPNWIETKYFSSVWFDSVLRKFQVQFSLKFQQRSPFENSVLAGWNPTNLMLCPTSIHKDSFLCSHGWNQRSEVKSKSQSCQAFPTDAKPKRLTFKLSTRQWAPSMIYRKED